MNLIRAELLRLVARRFTQALLVIMLAAFGVTFATTMTSSHQPTPAEITRAETQAAAARAENARSYQRCLEAVASSGDAARALQICGPPLPEVGAEDFLQNVFVFREQVPSLLYFLAAFLALFGFLVGASYVGAELTSGGMTNLLLWRPNRDLVLGTKLGVLLGAVLATSVVSTVVYVGSFWALAQVGGLPGDLGGEFWGGLALLALRVVVFALVAAAGGFALATLGRHTAAALGVAAGYLVVWEIGARIVLSVTGSSMAERSMLSSYVIAWMQGRYEIFDFSCNRLQGCTDTVTLWHSAVVFAVVLTVVVGGAFLHFRRRDLT